MAPSRVGEAEHASALGSAKSLLGRARHGESGLHVWRSQRCPRRQLPRPRLPLERLGRPGRGHAPSDESVLQGPAFYKWGWPYESNSQGYYSKIRSYCFTQDWACTSNDSVGNANTWQNSYNTLTDQVFNWVLHLTSCQV